MSLKFAFLVVVSSFPLITFASSNADIKKPDKSKHSGGHSALVSDSSHKRVNAVLASSQGKTFSSAYNFSSLSQVDKRTGQLSMSIPLGTIKGNGLLGPSFSLSLNYGVRAYYPHRYGLGPNWGFNLSFYDSGYGGYMTLSEGQSFPLASGSDVLAYHKLQDIHLSTPSGYSYKIANKNGGVTYLNSQGYTTKICNMAGKCLYFYYQAGNELTSIRDDSNHTLLTIHWYVYGGRGIVDVALKSDNDDVGTLSKDYSFLLGGSGGITKITFPNKEQATIEYCDSYTPGCIISSSSINVGDLIYKISDPTHSVHQYSYQKLLGPVTSSGEIAKAAVKTEKNYSLGRALSTKTYTFGNPEVADANNYLGYRSGSTYFPNRDTLYSTRASQYLYTTKVSNDAGDYVVNLYNHYHELMSTKIYDASDHMVSAQLYCYSGNFGYCSDDKAVNPNVLPSRPYTSFNQLPDAYSKPVQVFTAYLSADSNNFRIEKEEREYDVAGNLIHSVDAQGITKDITYCPLGGDSSGCVAFPFLNFIKSEQVTSSDGNTKELKKYSYSSLLSSSIKLASVKVGYQEKDESPTYWKGTQLSYFDANDDIGNSIKEYTDCLLDSKENCLNNSTDNVFNQNSVVFSYDTTSSDSSYGVTKTISSGALSTAKTNYVHFYTDNVHKTSVNDSVFYHKKFDNEGNILLSEICEDKQLTSCKDTVTFDYVYPGDSSADQDNGFYVVKTLPTGAQEKTSYNGFDDVLSQYVRDNDKSPWILTQHYVYDKDGRVQSDTRYVNGFTVSHEGSEILSYVPVTTTYSYNILGNEIESKQNNGTRIETIYDNYRNRVISFLISKENHISSIEVKENNAGGDLKNSYVFSPDPKDYTLSTLANQLTTIEAGITDTVLNNDERKLIITFIDSAISNKAAYQTESFSYDGLARLVSKNDNGRVETTHYNQKGFVDYVESPIYIDKGKNKRRKFLYAYNLLNEKLTSAQIEEVDA